MQPKRRNRKRALTIGKWVDAAESAKKLLDAPVPRGQVQSRLKEAATSVGLTHNTLSNYLLSYEFVSEVERERPDVAHILFRAAPVAVDAYRRWAKHDVEGAYKHVLEYGKGGIRIADVIEAEKKARQQTFPDKTSDAFDRLMRSNEIVAGHVPKQLADSPLATVAWSTFNAVESLPRYDGAFARWLGLTQIGIGRDGPLNEILDQWLREDQASAARAPALHVLPPSPDRFWRGKADFPDFDVRLVGVIEVRPVAIKENYRAIARQVALQATVASRFFDFVVVLLTDEEAMVELTSFLDAHALPPARQDRRILAPWVSDDVARARLRDLSFLPLPGAEGSVMFTCPEHCIPILMEETPAFASAEKMSALLRASAAAVTLPPSVPSV